MHTPSVHGRDVSQQSADVAQPCLVTAMHCSSGCGTARGDGFLQPERIGRLPHCKPCCCYDLHVRSCKTRWSTAQCPFGTALSCSSWPWQCTVHQCSSTCNEQMCESSWCGLHLLQKQAPPLQSGDGRMTFALTCTRRSRNRAPCCSSRRGTSSPTS